MPSYTPIAVLPYPTMSEPPNGPDQLQQLARAIEPKLVNRYKTAADRGLRVTAPTLGMMSFRDDAKVFEFWNGTVWAGTDQSIAIPVREMLSVTTDRVFTTNESPQLSRVDFTITNPSTVYRMCYFFHAEFNVTYNWSTAGQYAMIRHYAQIDSGSATTKRDWSRPTTLPGISTSMSGAWPARTGFIAAGASMAFSTWITVEKTNTVSGTITLLSSSCDMSVMAVSTV